MAIGDTMTIGTGKFGQAWASFRVEEGGNLGPVEYYVQTSIYQADGVEKTAAQVNQDLKDLISAQRTTQGATAVLNPPLESYTFFAD